MITPPFDAAHEENQYIKLALNIIQNGSLEEGRNGFTLSISDPAICFAADEY